MNISHRSVSHITGISSPVSVKQNQNQANISKLQKKL